jgi:cyclopropane fatty-acyl-phospholipid synthase-like methyltransferase
MVDLSAGPSEQTVDQHHPGHRFPAATRPDAALLDLGCGTGHFIPHAVQKGYKSYLGVDISTDMLAQAKQRHPGARFAAASATNFTQTVPNVAGAFDAVVSIMMVCALARRQDIVDVYRQSHVALNDSGTLVVCVPHPAHDPYMQCGMHGDNWVSRFHCFVLSISVA